MKVCKSFHHLERWQTCGHAEVMLQLFWQTSSLLTSNLESSPIPFVMANQCTSKNRSPCCHDLQERSAELRRPPTALKWLTNPYELANWECSGSRINSYEGWSKHWRRRICGGGGSYHANHTVEPQSTAFAARCTTNVLIFLFIYFARVAEVKTCVEWSQCELVQLAHKLFLVRKES